MLRCAILVAAVTCAAASPDRIVVDPSLAERSEPTVATLEAAVEWVAGQAAGDDAFEILLVPGVHQIRRTVRLTSDVPPLTIRADSGARLVGGVVLIDPHWLSAPDGATRDRLPQQARQSVQALQLAQTDLNGWAGGLTGPVHRGMGVAVGAVRSELFVSGRALTPARWPNDGFASVDGVTDPGSIPRNAADDIPPERRVIEPARGATFLLHDPDRLARWASASDTWVSGYWWWDWADEQLPVADIDPKAQTVKLGLPHRYGVRDSARFYITNLPEELDAPGEYWIDEAEQMIYAWLPEGAEHDEVAVSLLAEPLLALDGCRDVTIENLTLEYARGGGVVATHTERITIQSCTFRNLGARAVQLDGSDCAVRKCLFEEVGGGGVALSGGDRATLTHAGNIIEDCAFRRCGRLLRTYNPAIRLGGVGQRVVHNEIHDLPHIALMFSGNEHIIEGNRIHHVVQETGDAGAIYCGRDWTIHGTVIRGNFFHDIAGSDARYQNAVYLDDMASGITVEGNLFVRCNWGMLVGGGRDNTIRANAFVACGKAMQYDARGVGWMARHIADPATSTLHRNLAAVPIDQEPWKSRYPVLGGYLTDRFGRPVGGVVEGNALVSTPLGAIADRECVRVASNEQITIDDASLAAFADDAPSHQRSALFDPGDALPDFVPIRFGAIGPRTDRIGAQ